MQSTGARGATRPYPPTHPGRARRSARCYETANGLAMDIQRHLSNEPAVARPPSVAYKFQKLVRRNKLTFAAVPAVAAVRMFGVVASIWQAMLATRAKHAEQAARQTSEENARVAKDNAARVDTERLRAEHAHQRAELSELAARRRAYASGMNLVQQSLRIRGGTNNKKPPVGFSNRRLS